jgi:small-conductance mechanosensitive channel
LYRRSQTKSLAAPHKIRLLHPIEKGEGRLRGGFLVHFAVAHGDLLIGILLVLAAAVAALGIHFLLFRFLRGRQHTTRGRCGLRKYLATPSFAILLAIGLRIVLPFMARIPEEALDWLEQVTECLLVLFAGWLAIGGIQLFQSLFLSRFDTTVADNLRARSVHTQMQFFRRVLIGVVLLLDAGALLWTLHDERLWKLGTGLLASAGLASLVLAAAAKSTAANLIAGMQIALSEPIRIDDVVVIQGEWGRIEEITSTYVIVKIWDERRLVVPLSYFIEQPFENWTRRRSDLLGTAFLYVDYSVPIEPLRAALERIVSASPLWDGRVCGLQVTNLTDRCVELRCLVSAKGSSQCFDLRCLVREKMIAFLQSNYPSALPAVRLSMQPAAEPSEAAAATGRREP